MWEKTKKLLLSWIHIRNLVTVLAIVVLRTLAENGYQLPEWLDLILAAFGISQKPTLKTEK